MNNYFSLRKRGLALFVALMMCLSLLPGTALAADGQCTCGSGPSYKDYGDGTHAAYCESCGYYAQVAHSYGEDGKCVCGAEDPSASKPEEHVCTEFDATAHCTECGKLDRTHVHSYNEDGKCVCGEQKPEEHVHSWTYYESLGNGTHRAVCSCGSSETGNCTLEKVWSETDKIDVLKCSKCGYNIPCGSAAEHHHDYGPWQYDETVSKDQHFKVCKSQDGSYPCPEQRVFENCVESEKDEKGYTYCTVCDRTMSSSVVIGPGGDPENCEHEFGNVVIATANGTHFVSCMKCGYKKEDPCQYVPVYDSTGGKVGEVCPVCGSHNDSLPYDACKEDPNGQHKWEETNVKIQLEDGQYYTQLKCSLCGDVAPGKLCNSSNEDKGEEVYYDLIVNYVYEDGSTAATSAFRRYTADVAGSISIDSPKISGYTASQDKVDAPNPAKSMTVTVTYSTKPVEKKHTLTIVYVCEGEAGPFYTVTGEYAEGAQYSVDSQAAPDGYELADSNQSVVSGTMPDEDVTIKVEYKRIATYKLTITYRYADGCTEAEVVSYDLPEGYNYSYDTPDVDGHRADKEKVDGVMPAWDLEKEVVYSANNYTWTIKYVDANGDPMPGLPDLVTSFNIHTLGDLEDHNVPAQAGYSADQGTVARPAALADKEDTVVYTANTEPQPETYTVTIHYVYATGGQAAEDYQENRANGTYSVTSPVIEGYTADQLTVTVTVNGRAVEVTVIYTAVSPEPDPTPTPDPTPVIPTPTPTPTPAPADPGTTINEDETPLGGTIGLDTTNHFAYIIGYENDTVRPLANITRAEAVTIFFRLMTDEYRTSNWSTQNGFSDVNAGDWHNNAISTCLKAGALSHFAQDARFLPDQAITRAEFASIAAGFIDEQYTGETVGDFSDTEGHWASEAIRKAVEAGWISGDGNSFRPDDPISRAEVMTMVNRMLDRVPDKEHMLPDMKTWSDNPEDAWYYEAVQEATNEHAYERDEMGIVESWTELLKARDWAALEEEWAEAGSAPAPAVPETEGGDE